MRETAGVLDEILDFHTKEAIVYKPVTGLTDADCDGVVFRKKGTTYLKRVIQDSINVQWYGAKGDGITDDAEAIQKAINAASVLKGVQVWFPKTDAFYRVVPWYNLADESGSCLVTFIMRSNMHLQGEAGAIIKIADNVSTDAAPVSMAMFATNGVLQDVSFHNLVMDMNGLNNKISPNRPASYTRTNQSHILVSGTPNGVAARMSDVVIENCSFLNTAGVCPLVVAQSNVHNVELGKNWVIRGNLFKNNGSDTDDCTCIFAWADDVLCENNRFENDVQYNGNWGNTAYEVHGSNHVFRNNYIRNFYRGAWISSNYTSEVNNTLILNNIFDKVLFYGVDVFRTIAALSTIKGVQIQGNTFTIDGLTPLTPAPDLKAAVQVACEYSVSDISVSGNRAYVTGYNVPSAFMSVTPQQVAGQSYKNIICENNTATGLTFGIFTRTNATNSVSFLAVRNNAWVNNTPAGGSSAIGNFIDAVGQIDTLELRGNTAVDERDTPQYAFGDYLSGTANIFYYAGGNYNGMTDSEVSDTLVAVERKGSDPFSVKTLGDQSIEGKKEFKGTTPIEILSEESNSGGINYKNGSNTAGFYVGLSGDTSGNYVVFDRLTGLPVFEISKETGNTFLKGTLKIESNFIDIGKTGSGTGGNVRMRSDTDLSKWLTGLLGAPGERDYSIYDLEHGIQRLRIHRDSGVAYFSNQVAGANAIADDHFITKAQLDAKSTLSSGGAVVAFDRNRDYGVDPPLTVFTLDLTGGVFESVVTVFATGFSERPTALDAAYIKIASEPAAYDNTKELMIMMRFISASKIITTITQY